MDRTKLARRYYINSTEAKTRQCINRVQETIRMKTPGLEINGLRSTFINFYYILLQTSSIKPSLLTFQRVERQLGRIVRSALYSKPWRPKLISVDTPEKRPEGY